MAKVNRKVYMCEDELVVDLGVTVRVSLNELGIHPEITSTDKIKALIVRELDQAIRTAALGLEPVSYEIEVVEAQAKSTSRSGDTADTDE